VRDSVNQVCLAEPSATADEERVVATSAASCCRHGRCVRKAGSTDPPRSSQTCASGSCPWEPVRDGSEAPPAARQPAQARETRSDAASPTVRAGARRTGRLNSGSSDPSHLNRPTRHLADRLCECRHEMVAHPLEHELVASRQGKYAVGQVVELDPRKPLVERRKASECACALRLCPKVPWVSRVRTSKSLPNGGQETSTYDPHLVHMPVEEGRAPVVGASAFEIWERRAHPG